MDGSYKCMFLILMSCSCVVSRKSVVVMRNIYVLGLQEDPSMMPGLFLPPVQKCQEMNIDFLMMNILLV
jgi:hypothetical protein